MFDFENDANGGNIDPGTLQSMFQALPQIQQAQRRAQQLRGAQQYFQQMGQQETPGNYTPSQKGGLYQTVQQWQPDYAKIGNAISGGLGSLYANSQANTAEDQYNAVRNPAVLGWLQRGSQQGGFGNGGFAGGGFGSGNRWSLQNASWPGAGGGWVSGQS